MVFPDPGIWVFYSPALDCRPGTWQKTPVRTLLVYSSVLERPVCRQDTIFEYFGAAPPGVAIGERCSLLGSCAVLKKPYYLEMFRAVERRFFSIA